MREVTVTNWDESRLNLRKELELLRKKMAASHKPLTGFNLNMDVNGLPDLIQLIFTLIETLNSIDYAPKITIPEIKIPEFPEIEIPEIKAPSVIVPTPNVTVNPAEVNIDLRGVIDALENLKFISDRPNKPISVRMSDGQKFVKAITELKQATENLGVVYSGQSGVTVDELKTITGRVATDYIFDGTARVTPKFAVIDNASIGDNTLVSAVTGKKIRVLQYVLIASNTVNVRFESGAGGTALTGQMNLIANTGVSSGFSPIGHFETASGALLNLELSGAVSVDGHLAYAEI